MIIDSVWGLILLSVAGIFLYLFIRNVVIYRREDSNKEFLGIPLVLIFASILVRKTFLGGLFELSLLPLFVVGLVVLVVRLKRTHTPLLTIVLYSVGYVAIAIFSALLMSFFFTCGGHC